jgi:hypothetical protein
MSKKDDSAAYGMELRDYFAAAALQGMMADSTLISGSSDGSAATLAKIAYKFADAMLKEREEKK